MYRATVHIERDEKGEDRWKGASGTEASAGFMLGSLALARICISGALFGSEGHPEARSFIVLSRSCHVETVWAVDTSANVRAVEAAGV
jgi:hypothetical protein